MCIMGVTNTNQLWKRRWVEIDSSGNLVLSPSKHNEKGVTKRFHLSDFRTPYPPDQDRQELPNSVVLDFIDGRTLQCACETYIGQAHVLQSEFNRKMMVCHLLTAMQFFAKRMTLGLRTTKRSNLILPYQLLLPLRRHFSLRVFSPIGFFFLCHDVRPQHQA